MAASPAYTFFAGLGEVTGGLLLVFRRTATLGALVVFGVMLNIMIHRALKAIVVFCAFALPIYDHVKKEIEYEHPEAVESEHLLINRGFRWISEYPFNR